MNKEGVVCMEHLPAGFLLDTSIPWVQKRVREPEERLWQDTDNAIGWAPSTFKSSRNDRGSKKVMRPEDFMDDEDMAELQESRKLVDEEAVVEDTRGLHASDKLA